MAQAPEFGTHVLALYGELDIETAPAARDEGVLALERSGLDHLVLDLGAVTFVGSSGVSALVEIRNRAQQKGITVELADVPDRVRHVIELSGLGGEFPPH